MSRFQRIQNIVIGVGMLLAAGCLIVEPEDGGVYILLLLAVSLLVRGVAELIYYFTMARCMVGGKLILFIGAAFLDIGLFTLSLANESRFFVTLYLIGFHAFAGAVNILRSLEAMRYKSVHWKSNMLQGIVSILMLVASLFFAKDETMLVYLYSIGLIYSACVRIASAFKRSAVVFIQ